jgi:hypothetical protein
MGSLSGGVFNVQARIKYDVIVAVARIAALRLDAVNEPERT